MRKTSKRPSEWLRLLCRDWAVENDGILDTCDQKFMEFKPYLRGILTSQLLCRLIIPPVTHQDTGSNSMDGTSGSPCRAGGVDFLNILGVEDEFDKSYIVAQVERFCALYNIRGLPADNDRDGENLFATTDDHLTTLTTQDAASIAAGISVSPNGGIVGLPSYLDSPQTAAAAAAVAAVTQQHDDNNIAAANSNNNNNINKLTKKQVSEVSRAQRMAKDAEKALEQERRQHLKKEEKRLVQERKEHKLREREAMAMRKAQDRSQREATREDRRQKKLEIRMQREKFAQEQKDLALKRAAELVASNRVPIEITRGAAAAKAAVNAALAQAGGMHPPTIPEPPVVMTAASSSPTKKTRSAIVVSTAADLHQIVTHSKNLWAKYNAIAKEHNQKVNWITVAKELGIHVKVREKYARMHSRAEQRAFDWVKHGHIKIKDHPEIFIEPTESEQKAKMPLPPPDSTTTVLIDGNKEVNNVNVNHDNHHNHHYNHHHVLDDDVERNMDMADNDAAEAARVVDAAGVGDQPVETMLIPIHHQEEIAANVTFVADPTANFMHHHHEETGHHQPSPTVV
jgi:hypothetical protein